MRWSYVFLALPHRYGVIRPVWVNSVWPSDTMWRQKSGSTLAQDGTKPFISDTNHKTRLKIAVLKWHPGLPGANELTEMNARISDCTCEHLMVTYNRVCHPAIAGTCKLSYSWLSKHLGICCILSIQLHCQETGCWYNWYCIYSQPANNAQHLITCYGVLLHSYQHHVWWLVISNWCQATNRPCHAPKRRGTDLVQSEFFWISERSFSNGLALTRCAPLSGCHKKKIWPQIYCKINSRIHILTLFTYILHTIYKTIHHVEV